MAKKKAPKDALEALAQRANDDPKVALALFLWQDRHRNPELGRQITEKDVSGFEACCEFLEVEPDVMIVRPQGLPALPGTPAVGKRKAVPARPAEAARPFVVVQLVQKGTADGFKPIENNEEDAKLRDQAAKIHGLRSKAPMIASQLMADMRSGVFSSATITEAAEALNALARA